MSTLITINKKIFIFGSCVSRDIFNLENRFHLTDYYARSSFASIAQLPFIDHAITQRIESAFQTKVVNADMKRMLWLELEKQDFDILLLDFIDVRFNLLKIDQTICTLSNEAMSTGFLDEYRGKGIIQNNTRWFSKIWKNSLFKENKQNRIIQSTSKEFSQMWEEGWEEFISFMKKNNSLDKVILNKVYFAEKTQAGHRYGPPTYSKTLIIKMNKFLDHLYSIAEQSIPPENVMHFSKSLMLGADEHQWGRSPFHYVDEYYESALNFLDNWNRSEKK